MVEPLVKEPFGRRVSEPGARKFKWKQRVGISWLLRQRLR